MLEAANPRIVSKAPVQPEINIEEATLFAPAKQAEQNQLSERRENHREDPLEIESKVEAEDSPNEEGSPNASSPESNELLVLNTSSEISIRDDMAVVNSTSSTHSRQRRDKFDYRQRIDSSREPRGLGAIPREVATRYSLRRTLPGGSSTLLSRAIATPYLLREPLPAQSRTTSRQTKKR